MKTTIMFAALITAGSAAAYGQDPPPAQPPAPAASAVAPTPVAHAQPSDDRLNEVKFMEGIFATAVRSGASELARRMQLTEPGSVMTTGIARARGIALNGYGVVFDVDVPLMNLAVVTSLKQSLINDLAVQIRGLREFIAHSNNADDIQRAQFQLRMFTAQLQAMAPATDQARPLDNTILDRPQGDQRAASVTNTAPAPGTVSAATVPDVAPALPPIETRDTNELYTDAVKRALINVMIDHSAALKLADDEWLTVGARDNAGPAMPGAIDERSGIILRIKGSDLGAFRANKLSRDEVVKKIEIQEWR